MASESHSPTRRRQLSGSGKRGFIPNLDSPRPSSEFSVSSKQSSLLGSSNKLKPVTLDELKTGRENITILELLRRGVEGYEMENRFKKADIKLLAKERLRKDNKDSHRELGVVIFGEEELCEDSSDLLPPNSSKEPPPPKDIMAPQLRLTADGKIVVDEESLLVERSSSMKIGSSVIEEDNFAPIGMYQKTSSWINNHKKCSLHWTEKENERFFLAVQMVGLDFGTLSYLFPDREPKEIKEKFKREDKLRTTKLDHILAHPIPLNKEKLILNFQAEMLCCSKAMYERRLQKIRYLSKIRHDSNLEKVWVPYRNFDVEKSKADNKESKVQSKKRGRPLDVEKFSDIIKRSSEKYKSLITNEVDSSVSADSDSEQPSHNDATCEPEALESPSHPATLRTDPNPTQLSITCNTTSPIREKTSSIISPTSRSLSEEHNIVNSSKEKRKKSSVVHEVSKDSCTMSTATFDITAEPLHHNVLTNSNCIILNLSDDENESRGQQLNPIEPLKQNPSSNKPTPASVSTRKSFEAINNSKKSLPQPPLIKRRKRFAATVNIVPRPKPTSNISSDSVFIPDVSRKRHPSLQSNTSEVMFEEHGYTISHESPSMDVVNSEEVVSTSSE